MRDSAVTAIIAAGCVIMAIAVLVFPVLAELDNQTQFDSADVKIVHETGHGSGFLLANGLVITAAHVIADQEREYTVKTQSGRIYKPEILWVNEALDIAALWIDAKDISHTKLRCDTIKPGEIIEARGFPYDLEYLKTIGRLSAKARPVKRHWSSVYIMDVAVGPGMSGGGVYANGEVIGVTVGLRMAQMGYGGGPSGFAYAVPSSEVCKLLGR